jgi:hypothetical protein
MDRQPLPRSPAQDLLGGQPLTLLQGKLSHELIATVCASLTGGLQDLLHTHKELAVTLVTLDALHGSPVVEIVVKAQEVLRELLTVVETLRQSSDKGRE